MVDIKNTNATALTIAPNGPTLTGCSTSTSLPQNRDITIASDGTNYRCSSTVAPGDVALGSVTNDAQTKAAVVPNTAPSAGQLLVGNAGGTAYAPVTLSGSCTLASTGVITCSGSSGNPAAKVTTTFNASTMTFTCSSNTINDFVLSTALTANVTASAVASCNSGQFLTFTLTQDATGGRTFVWPTGFSSAVAPSPVASASTKETFWYDGTNYILLGTSVDSGPNAFGVETSAPGTPPASNFFWWGDSTNHIFSYKANNSATVSNTVVPDTGASNNFLTAISAGGVISKAQPTLLNLATFSSANLATQLTDETGTAGSAVFSVSPALTGSPTAPSQTQGDNSTKLATTAYTDTAVSNAIAGVNPAVSVQAATTGVLPASTYSNGASGIGATLTETSAAALVVDGYTVLLNDRLLVKNQASTFQNGVYTMTTLGTGVIPFVLTRALDYDQPSDMNNTGAIPVQNGTSNIATSWVQTSKVTTVGTDAVTFTQYTLNPSTLVTASSPGVGLAHFAGSTQAVTSSLLVAADITANTITGAQMAPVDFTTPGASKTFTSGVPYSLFECTTTCTITMPVPAAGQQYCVRNANNVSTVITLSAIGSSARYENTAHTAYGTAGTGTFVSGGAVGDQACLVGKDSTHFDVWSFNGTWTAN